MTASGLSVTGVKSAAAAVEVTDYRGRLIGPDRAGVPAEAQTVPGMYIARVRSNGTARIQVVPAVE
jgi:hypothetical protein